MIVIATNNGIDFLPRLLDSINNFPTKHKVLVVDTGSTDDAFLLYLSKPEKKKWNFKLEIDYIDGGRDTGAYVHAFKKYPKEDYMFMHDSMEATDKDWLKRFSDKAKKSDIVAHSLIDMNKDGYKPVDSLLEKLPFAYIRPVYGIFGPIFYATNHFMQKARLAGALGIIPKDREEAHTTERAWGAIVEHLGMKMDSVYGLFDYDSVNNNQLDGLRKCFPIRP